MENSSSETLGNAVIMDDNGNSYVAGYFTDEKWLSEKDYLKSIGGRTAFFVKYDASGEVQWSRIFDSEGDDEISDVFLIDNDIFITGYFSGAISFDGVNTVYASTLKDGFIIKMNIFGDFIWSETLEGDGNEIISKIKVIKNVYTNPVVIVSGTLGVESPISSTSKFGSLMASTSTLSGTDVFIGIIEDFGGYYSSHSLIAIQGNGNEYGNALDLQVSESNSLQLAIGGNLTIDESTDVNFQTDPSFTSKNVSATCNNSSYCSGFQSFISYYQMTDLTSLPYCIDAFNLNERYGNIYGSNSEIYDLQIHNKSENVSLVQVCGVF